MNKSTLLLVIGLLSSLLIFAQKDTEFWFAAPEISSVHADKPVYLKISTFSAGADVTISQPANPSFTPILKNIASGNIAIVDLTGYLDMLETKPADKILPFGLLIQASDSINVYYEVLGNGGENTDIFTLKGNVALGKSYFIPAQNVWDNWSDKNAWSSFDIVATEDSTVITITPSKTIYGGHNAGTPYSITLQKGEVYSARANGQTANDHLFGTKVTSNKPIAITIKDDSMHQGDNWDLFGDQIIPVDKLGKKYIAVKGASNADKIFVIPTENNTEVKVNGVIVDADLDLSELVFKYDLSAASTYIETSNFAYVIHVSGVGDELGGALLPPIECTGSLNASFVRSSDDDFYLMILTEDKNKANFTLKSGAVTTPINAASFQAVPGTNPVFVAAKIQFSTAQVATGVQSVLSNSKGVFHVGLLNYAALGGLSGAQYGYFSNYSNVANAGPNVEICSGASVQLTATGGMSYTWSTSTDPTEIGSSNKLLVTPVATTTYIVSVNDGFGCSGMDNVTVTVHNSPTINNILTVQDSCQSKGIIDIDAMVNSPELMSNFSAVYQFEGAGAYSLRNNVVTQPDEAVVSALSINGVTDQSTTNLLGLKGFDHNTNDYLEFTVTAKTGKRLLFNSTDKLSFSISSDAEDADDEIQIQYNVDGAGWVPLTALPIPNNQCGNFYVISGTTTSAFTLSPNHTLINNCIDQSKSLTINFDKNIYGGAMLGVNEMYAYKYSPEYAPWGNTQLPIPWSGTGFVHSYTFNGALSTHFDNSNGFVYDMLFVFRNQDGSTKTDDYKVKFTKLETTNFKSFNLASAQTTVGGNIKFRIITKNVSNAAKYINFDNIAVSGATIIPTGNALSYDIGGAKTTAHLFTGLTSGYKKVTITDSYSCIDTSTVLVPKSPAPVASISNGAIGCTELVLLTATDATQKDIPTYKWSVNANSATKDTVSVNPPAQISTLYTVTISYPTGCFDTETRTLLRTGNLDPAPSGDTILCLGESTTLKAFGGISYVWRDSLSTILSTTDSLVVTPPLGNTTYIVHATNGGCTGTSAIVVTTHQLPTANITDKEICKEQTTAILTASGGVSYSWNTLSITDTIVVAPLSQTTYTVTATDSNGCTDSDQSIVIVNEPPTAVVLDSEVCIGQTSATLTASGGTSYSWDTGGGTNKIIVSPAVETTYTLTVTDAKGCTDSEDAIVVAHDNPIAVVDDNALCLGQTSATLKATGGISYIWDGGSTLDSIVVSPIVNTTYTVTVTDSNGCTDIDNAIVTVNGIVATITPNTAICPGQTFTTIKASGGSIYKWNTGAEIDSLVVSPTINTTYTVTVSNANGCSDVKSTIITTNPIPTAVVSDTAICLGQKTATLIATGGVSYVWNTSANTDKITVAPNSNTTYTVTATNSTGCTDSEEVIVTVHGLPTADAGNDQTICPETSTITLDGTNSTGTGLTYKWNNANETNVSITITQTGEKNYTLTVTDSNGCTDLDETAVKLHTSPTILVTNQSNCPNLPTTLTATGGVSYSWNTGDNTPSITKTVATNTQYIVTGTDANGCTAQTTGTISVTTPPTANAGNDVSICGGSSTSLLATGGTTYAWSNNTNNATTTVTPTQTTTYTVTINPGACSNTDEVVVVLYNNPWASFVINTPVSAHIQFMPITFTDNSQTDNHIVSYLWDFGDGIDTTISTPSVTHHYQTAEDFMIKLWIEDEHGCEDDTLYTALTINPSVKIFIPSAFSPNNDGKNDVFKVYGQLASMHIQVFDQWGIKVFETENQENTWDGKWRGKLQPAGNYTYIFEGITKTGENIKQPGVVTLVR